MFIQSLSTNLVLVITKYLSSHWWTSQFMIKFYSFIVFADRNPLAADVISREAIRYPLPSIPVVTTATSTGDSIGSETDVTESNAAILECLDAKGIDRNSFIEVFYHD